MKILITNLVLAILLITLFDAATFFFLPKHYVSKFWEYRRDTPREGVGHGGYPEGYFIEHEQRGFDIGKNRSGEHWVDGITYPVWSNSFGCYDTEHDINEQYFYFAGDSFTWGYAPFDKKFGTIIGDVTGIHIFKCGVTHTGQKHQFEKLVQITDEYGTAPDAILVFYFFNDALNDYAYPHSTVVDGWLIDSVSVVDNNDLIRHTRVELALRVKDGLEKIKKKNITRDSQPKLWLNIKRTLKYYSLTVNLIDYMRDSAGAVIKKPTANTQANTQKPLKSFYSLPRLKDDKYWYTNNPFAEYNKNALIDFKNYSKDNATDLVVILIPPKHLFREKRLYKELHDYLDEKGIRYLDLATIFDNKGLDVKDLYWVDDAHFSSSGNKVIADILLDELDDIFNSNNQN